MAESFNIVKLIEKNPLSCLSKDYQSKLLNKIKEQFNNDKQQLFIASFYSYLNYNKNDFVIDLSDIWQWLGFSEKSKCKKLLVKNFIERNDYKILLALEVEQDKIQHGGHNKEKILMTINTFKELCIKANTQKAKDIRNYFIKLEEIIFETINEEVKDLKELVNKQQLEIKNTEEIINKQELEKKLDKQNILLESYHLKNIFYLIHIRDNLYKFGYTNNIKQRFQEHKSSINNDIKLIFCIESTDNKQLEYNFKDYLNTTNYKQELYFNNNIQTEIIETNDIEFIKQKIIKYNEDFKENRLLINDLKEYNKKLLNKLAEKNITPESEDNEFKEKIKKLQSIIDNLHTKLIDYDKIKETNEKLHININNLNIENLKLKDLLKNKDIELLQKIKQDREESYINNIKNNINNNKPNIILTDIKSQFKNEDCLSFIEPNPGSRLSLLTIINKIKEYFIIDNDNEDFRNNLIEFIKSNFSIDTALTFEDEKRFKRCIFKDISLSSCCSFYPNDVYINFISENIDIKTLEKDPKNKNKYKYYVKITDVYTKFKKYITENNIKKIYKFESGEVILHKHEFYKYICKYTNSDIRPLIYDKSNTYKSFVGIILK